MSKELFISTTPHETKVAIVEDEELTEIYFERENEYTLAGSIYNGKVTRVLPGMQSAFVDIGLERDAFLYVTDFLDLEEQEDDQVDPVMAKITGDQAHVAERNDRSTDRSGDRFSDRSNRQERGGREREGQVRGGRGQRPSQSQRDLSRAPSARKPGETIIEADFTTDSEAEAVASPERHHGAIIPETEAGGDSGARRYEGRRGRRPRSGGRREFEEAKFAEDKDKAVEVKHGPLAEARPARVERQRTQSSGAAEFVLAGESLQKYGAPAAAMPGEEVRAAHTEANPRHRPSTEVDLSQITSTAFDGFKLPGETLSRYQKPARKETDQAKESQDKANQGAVQPDASASVRSEPDVARFVWRRKIKKQELEDDLAEEAESSAEPTAMFPAESHDDEERNARGETTNVEVATAASSETPQTEATGESEAAQEVAAQSVAVAEETNGNEAHSFEPGSGDIEEVEEEFQEDDFDGIGAAEYAEDEFSVEEMEEETLSGPSEDLVAAVARAASANHIGDETEEAEEGEHKPEFVGVFTEADFTGGSEVEDEEEESGSTGTQPRERRGRQQRGRRPMQGRKNIQSHSLPTISDLLKEGQEVLVQIAKEPMAKKGARITSHIALPGRFLVFMPTVNHIGVSRKIGSDEERMRLKRILLSEKGDAHGGFIVRTAAANAGEEDLRADIRFLINLWNEIKHRAESGKSPALIYHDLNLVERVLRDQVSNSFSAIWVDSEQEYERIVRFLSRFQPAMVKRVKLYTKELPLYEQFGIQEEINKGLKSKVWLKSGGYIVINQTEALVAIDINTGKYVGKTARLEDTIVKTNIDAIQEIVRQIRLRDLGGIIVIDFIDMDERRNRQKVMIALEEALKSDRAPSKVLQFNDFG
ncbi:MAG: Rne/Rng family ribonuclease, partial [Acidobacteriaceae bacterium]